jgi:hypothetical protein
MRFCINACASSGLSQRCGSSALAFSSLSSFSDLSQSKTPPQQFQGLLDIGGERFDFGAHVFLQRKLGLAVNGATDFSLYDEARPASKDR